MELSELKQYLENQKSPFKNFLVFTSDIGDSIFFSADDSHGGYTTEGFIVSDVCIHYQGINYFPTTIQELSNAIIKDMLYMQRENYEHSGN